MKKKKTNNNWLFYLIFSPIVIPLMIIWKLVEPLFKKAEDCLINIISFAILMCIVISILMHLGYKFIIFIIIIGAIGVLYDSRKNKLPKNVPNFDAMSGEEFEVFCSKILMKNGFSNVKVTKSSGDQGIDIIANLGSKKYGIQCKRYSSNVGNHAIQEAYSGINYYSCDVGVVVTNSFFTQSAIDLSKKTGIELWDRNSLKKLIKNAYSKNADSSETLEDIEKEIKDVNMRLGNLYVDAIKYLCDCDVSLIYFDECNNVREYIYQAKSEDDINKIISFKYYFDEHFERSHVFKKLYDNKFLIRLD